jgi:hypothetical protein
VISTSSSSQRPPAPKVDPALVRLLEEPGDAEALLSAVFRLRPDGDELAVPGPETEAQAAQLVKRVAGRVGEAPERVNVLRNLGAFVVRARPAFLRELLHQPEIASALANTSGEELHVRPLAARAPRRRR